MSAAYVKSNARYGLRLHPLPVRIMHWINAAAMIIMIMSGWKIYNDDVIFSWLRFSDAITLGTWAQHGIAVALLRNVDSGAQCARLSDFRIRHWAIQAQAPSHFLARAHCDHSGRHGVPAQA
jgi:hypothetical protein